MSLASSTTTSLVVHDLLLVPVRLPPDLRCLKPLGGLGLVSPLNRDESMASFPGLSVKAKGADQVVVTD
jgi:hypothetical protein